jgi:glycosyltransferase involved in cell wall biosynthesis
MAKALDKMDGKPVRSVLILVENLPVPFDRRVWQEATTLRKAGYVVSVICPTGAGCEQRFEIIDDIHIYRYRLVVEASGAAGYAIEYGTALARTLWLTCRVWLTRGFDAIHACNPPDLFFLIGLLFKPFGKKFLFDHHDINPELYVAKFGRRDFFHRLLLAFERLSFRTANVAIATNESYRRIAIERGGMDPARTFVVRSGPSLARIQIGPPDDRLRHGRRHLVGYVGVIGEQEGIDDLLRVVHFIVNELKRKDVHFGIVGDGTALAAMKDLAIRLDIEEYVSFPGRVADELLLRVLNTADVCVNPDKCNEMNDKSTMNKILEYMALGKPIVQFEQTEGRESAGDASLYARPGDIADFACKLCSLLDDPERRRAMGTLGRKRILEKLEWRHQVPALLAAYDTLFASNDESSQPAPRRGRRRAAPQAR